LAVDRLRRQAAGLGDPKPGRIANGQDDPVLSLNFSNPTDFGLKSAAVGDRF
jgi:hypothetical protein